MPLRKLLILRSPLSGCLGSGHGEGRVTANPVTCFVGFAALVLILLAFSVPAQADALSDAIAGLGADSFSAKEKAVVTLGKNGDPRTVSVLQAFNGDRLRRAPDGRVI